MQPRTSALAERAVFCVFEDEDCADAACATHSTRAACAKLPEAHWLRVDGSALQAFDKGECDLFHAANVKARHAVNRAIGTRVKSNGASFLEFQELVKARQCSLCGSTEHSKGSRCPLFGKLVSRLAASLLCYLCGCDSAATCDHWRCVSVRMCARAC